MLKQSDVLKNDRKLRVGAVNLDCSLSADTYFGFYQTRAFSHRYELLEGGWICLTYNEVCL